MGALLIQVPSEIARDPQAYYNWIDTVAQGKVGAWAPFLSAFRLFNVFSSPWFITTGILLMLNILICSLNRWRAIYMIIKGGKVKHAEKFYKEGKTSAELKNIKGIDAKTGKIPEKILRERGYRTRTEIAGKNIYIAADKNRYFKLGTYFSHFSLILFVLAFIAGNYFGFRDLEFAVPEGSAREVGHDTALSLELVSFTAEYYENGSPKDFRSDVVLYDNGKPVKQAIIQVNHPLVYKGIRFYQSYFGQAIRMQVKDMVGLEIFNDGIPMDSYFDLEGYRRYQGFFDLPEAGFSIRVIGSASNANDPIIPPNHIAIAVMKDSEEIDFNLVVIGAPNIIGGLEFSFLGGSQYSGFQVSRDPENALIWIASILFMLGISAVLYFPYRQVWVLSQTYGRGNSRLLIRSRATRSFSSTSELKALVKQMEKEL